MGVQVNEVQHAWSRSQFYSYSGLLCDLGFHMSLWCFRSTHQDRIKLEDFIWAYTKGAGRGHRENCHTRLQVWPQWRRVGRNVGWLEGVLDPLCVLGRLSKAMRGKPQPTIREAPVLWETRSVSTSDSLQADRLGAVHRKYVLNTNTITQQLGPFVNLASCLQSVSHGLHLPHPLTSFTWAQQVLGLSPPTHSLRMQSIIGTQAQRYFWTSTLWETVFSIRLYSKIAHALCVYT